MPKLALEIRFKEFRGISGPVDPEIPTGNEITIDITDLTDIDLSVGNGIRIVNLTSDNPTEIINTISNSTVSGRITFRPAAGLIVQFNDTVIAGGNFRLYAPSLFPNGDKKGFLEVEKRANDFYQTNFIDGYN